MLRNILMETEFASGKAKTNIITHANPAIKAFGSFPKGDKGDTFMINNHTERKTLADRINQKLARPATHKGDLFGHPVSTIKHIKLTLL